MTTYSIHVSTDTAAKKKEWRESSQKAWSVTISRPKTRDAAEVKARVTGMGNVLGTHQLDHDGTVELPADGLYTITARAAGEVSETNDVIAWTSPDGECRVTYVIDPADMATIRRELAAGKSYYEARCATLDESPAEFDAAPLAAQVKALLAGLTAEQFAEVMALSQRS